MDYLSVMRLSTFDEQIPLAEVITDFFDQLKSRTKGTLLFHPSSDHLIDFHPTPSHLSSGYASMSFQEIGFRPDKLVRLDIRINGEDAPPLATIVHRDRAHDKGKIICNKLKELIPRQQFKVSLISLCIL